MEAVAAPNLMSLNFMTILPPEPWIFRVRGDGNFRLNSEVFEILRLPEGGFVLFLRLALPVEGRIVFDARVTVDGFGPDLFFVEYHIGIVYIRGLLPVLGRLLEVGLADRVHHDGLFCIRNGDGHKALHPRVFHAALGSHFCHGHFHSRRDHRRREIIRRGCKNRQTG